MIRSLILATALIAGSALANDPYDPYDNCVPGGYFDNCKNLPSHWRNWFGWNPETPGPPPYNPEEKRWLLEQCNYRGRLHGGDICQW